MTNLKANSIKISLLMFFCLILVNYSSAQKPCDRRTVDQYEQSGQYNQALECYLSYLQDNSKDIASYLGAKRCYLQLGELNKLRNLILTLQHTFRNVRFESDLAEIEYKEGKINQAVQHWKSIIEENAHDHQAYSIAGAALVNNQLLDDALYIFHKARRNFKDETLFIFEISNIYTAQSNYKALLMEYLSYLEKYPDQLLFIDSQLAQLTGDSESSSLQRELSHHIDEQKYKDINTRYLLAGVYIRNHDYDHALEHYIFVENLLSEKRGQSVLQQGALLSDFAELAMADKKFKHAQMAYEKIVEKNNSFSMQARLGLASVFEAQLLYTDAIRAYENFLSNYPAASEASTALMRIGDIWFYSLFDIDNAERVYTQVSHDFPNKSVRMEATFRLAECAILKNRIDSARRIYEKIRLSIKTKNDNNSIKLLLKMANLEFYAQHPLKALKYLDLLLHAPSEKKDGPINIDENDALKLYLVIQENKQDSIGLAILASAHLLEYQRQYDSCRRLIENYLPDSVNLSLNDELLFFLGDLYKKMQLYNNSILIFMDISNNPKSIYRDVAVKNCAEIYEINLAEREKAQEMYEKLLVSYPASIFVEQARDKIRLLNNSK